LQGTAADRIASTLLNLIYPSRCPVCEGPSDSYRTAPICTACFSGIERYEGPSCAVCFEPLASEHASTCGSCLKREPPFSRIVSYGLHTGALRAAVNFLKFYSTRRLARHLGNLVCELELPRVDCIVPVPMSARGLRERGFNQTLLIGRTVSKKTGVPVEAGLLSKVKDTPPQVGLSVRERRKNLRGAFKANSGLNGEKILLLDDVVTTATTARECSTALMKAGAGEVVVASVYRAPAR